MNNYLVTFVISMLLTVAVVAAVNYDIDPAKLFSENSFETEIAELLSRKKIIAGLRNYDERNVQKLLVQKFEKKPDIVVFGSSRSRKIRSDSFEDVFFYNHSMSGGVLQDYIGLWQTYKQESTLPGMIILNVDPWVFNRKNLQSRWKVFTNELNQFASESGIDVGDYVGSSIGTAKIRTLLSVEYLVESLKTLLHSNQKGRSYEVTNDAGHPKGAILADGSYVSPEERRYIAEDVLLKDAVNYVMQKPVYSLESFYSLDPVLVQMFEYLLNDMLSNGIEVTLLLTPYHPVTYELLHREGYQVINEVESYLIAVASSLNIKLRGSYDPQHTGCASEWFTDGMHPTMECMQVLISLDIS